MRERGHLRPDSGAYASAHTQSQPQTQSQSQHSTQSYGHQGNGTGSYNSNNQGRQPAGYTSDGQSRQPQHIDPVSLPPINVRNPIQRPDVAPPGTSPQANGQDDLDLPPFLKRFKSH